METVFGIGESNNEPPILGLTEYRTRVCQYPPPTDDQIQDFSEFVCHAKSWYKHLPLLSPGTPFCFYFDWYAGWDRIKKFGAGIRLVKREQDSKRLHYSHLPTEEYSRRFGLLSFSCERGTRIYDIQTKGLRDNNLINPIVYMTDGRSSRIPEEVANAGTVCLTGVIHKVSACAFVWDTFLPRVENTGYWPTETDGANTLARISERCLALRESSSSETEAFSLSRQLDTELQILIAPERNRLVREMTTAMKRVREIVYENKTLA